jgi:FKBP-type peptidyl-prolyl cis-trans isomerase FklB
MTVNAFVRQGVLAKGGSGMKSQWKIVLGLVALTAVAQDAPKTSSAAAGVAGSKTGATTAPAARNQSRHGVPAAKPNAKAQARALTEKEKRGYALGVQVSTDIARQGIEVDPPLLLQGLKDALTGNKLLMTFEDMNATLADMQKEQREKLAAALKEYSEKSKKDGEAFLAANKTKDGVVTLPSGLQYKILKAGDGKKPGHDDKVVCNYRGTLIDGTEIDSSYKRNEPSTLPITGVIKGWTEALQLMPVGSKWEIFVPSDLAYGEQGNRGVIGPNATLIFEVELLSIRDKTQDLTKPQGMAIKPQGSL